MPNNKEPPRKGNLFSLDALSARVLKQCTSTAIPHHLMTGFHAEYIIHETLSKDVKVNQHHHYIIQIPVVELVCSKF